VGFAPADKENTHGQKTRQAMVHPQRLPGRAVICREGSGACGERSPGACLAKLAPLLAPFLHLPSG
jgi:hypothetical protein